MSNLNKAMIIGRLGADPEARYTKSGQAVTDLRIATNETWKDKGGQRQERTEWHSIVAWGQQAEFATKYLKKGNLVFVEGRIQTRDWTDNQNVKHYKTEIVAQNLRSLERRGEGGGADYEQYDQASGGRGGGGGGASGGGGRAAEPEEAYVEDDIPF